MSVDTSVDGVDGVEHVSSMCRACVESVEPGLKERPERWGEAGSSSGTSAEALDGSQSVTPARRFDASAGGVGSLPRGSSGALHTAGAGSSRMAEDATRDDDMGLDVSGEGEFSSAQEEAAIARFFRQRRIRDRIQKAIIRNAVRGAGEEASVIDVVRTFGKGKGKVTRAEVKAAAQAMEDDDAALVMTRDGVIHYVGPSLKTMCERGEGRA